MPTERDRRGSALLAVLWLSAALAVIAFSLAITVRGEIDRASTVVDGLRSYYLASSGVERAAVELLWSIRAPEGERKIKRGSTIVNYTFPSGEVRVEILPDAGKMDVNHATPERLYRLMVSMGTEAERAHEIAMGIAEARRPGPPGGGSSGNSPFAPSFHLPRASFQEIEDLMLVNGMTPDILYGAWIPSGSGAEQRLERRPGLADCLTVYGSGDNVDVNTATPAVLAAMGVTPYAVNALVERRRIAPFTTEDLGPFLTGLGITPNGLRVEGNSIATLRATARLRLPGGRLSDLRRTVAAQVKYMPEGYDSLLHILRWYDTAWSD